MNEQREIALALTAAVLQGQKIDLTEEGARKVLDFYEMVTTEIQGRFKKATTHIDPKILR